MSEYEPKNNFHFITKPLVKLYFLYILKTARIFSKLTLPVNLACNFAYYPPYFRKSVDSRVLPWLFPRGVGSLAHDFKDFWPLFSFI